MQRYHSVSCRTLLDVVAAIAFAGVPLANASIHTFNVEIDLSLATITSDGSGGELLAGYNTTLVPVTPFTPQVGDVLMTTISFKNGDRLSIIDGPNTVTANAPFFESLTFYFDGPGYHYTSTTAASFSNLQGTPTSTTGSSQGVLGQSIDEFTDGVISFDGITLTTTITQLPGGNTYSQFGLWGGRAGGYEITTAAATPEPVSLLVWGGLAAVGICSRRSRRSLEPHMSPEG